MVDSPQGPTDRPEKPQADPLAGPILQPASLLPQAFLTAIEALMEGLCDCFPILLVLCGILASAVLFFSWADSGSHNGPFTCFIGLVFVGPLLFGMAGILYRLNQRKRDSRATSGLNDILPCSNCGRLLFRRAVTCPQCGKLTHFAEALSPCPDCGNHVSKLAKACPKCGRPTTA